MIYHFKIHKEKDGFWAQCLEISSIFTQASTMKELQHNMQEALNLYLEDHVDSDIEE